MAGRTIGKMVKKLNIFYVSFFLLCIIKEEVLYVRYSFLYGT